MNKPSKYLRALTLVPCLLLLWSHSASRVQAAAPPRRIEVTAKRFAYVPAEITVKKGEPVVLVLKTDDVAHGIAFKELNLKTDIGKDATAELPFTPDQVGTFVGHCSHFCGSGHGAMTLTLHVTE
jgi:cytochrome c oxidase subunit 2